jgi:putative hydrolase of the HAD superfamily
LYERFASPEVWKIHEDVLPAIDTLASQGFKLGILSNWDPRLRPLLKGLRLDRYFEALVISCEVGFTKPSPVIFEQAARLLGTPVGSILHVGNSYEEDMQGARSAKLQALLLDRQGKSGESVESLKELEWMLAGADTSRL